MKVIFFGENLHTFSYFKNAKKNFLPNINLGIQTVCKKIQ